MAGLKFGIGSPLIRLNPYGPNQDDSIYGGNDNGPMIPLPNTSGTPQIPPLRTNPLNPPDTSIGQTPLARKAAGALDPNFTSNLEQFRNTPTPDRDKYRALLQNMPERKDYQLSKLGKVLAGVSGTAEGYVSRDVGKGIKTGMGLIDRPYEQALGDYSTKGGMLKELSGLEYQDIQDKKGLEAAITKETMDKRAAYGDALKTVSGLDFTDKQMKNLDDEMSARGVTPMKNELDGQVYAVNWKNGTTTPMGKFFADLQNDRDFQIKLLGIQHGYKMGEIGAQEAGADRRSNAANRAGLAANITAAYNLAEKIAFDSNPDLFNAVYEVKDGNVVRKADANPAASGLLQQKIFQQANNILSDDKFKPDMASYVRTPSGDPAMIRQSTIEAIKTQFANDPATMNSILSNPDAIKDAEDQLRKAWGSPTVPELPKEEKTTGSKNNLWDFNKLSSARSLLPFFMQGNNNPSRPPINPQMAPTLAPSNIPPPVVQPQPMPQGVVPVGRAMGNVMNSPFFARNPQNINDFQEWLARIRGDVGRSPVFGGTGTRYPNR